METEHYQQGDTKYPAPSSQDMRDSTSTVEPHLPKKNWFYYAFGSFYADATDELEKALVWLEGEHTNRRYLDVAELFYLKSALYKVGLELLMRRNPQVREAASTWGTVLKRKNELHKQWEKEILAREGEEGLKRRKQNGEDPGSHYTHEELQAYVNFTKAKVEGGVAKPVDLDHALNVQKAGGFYQWDKERKRKTAESLIRDLAAVNNPDIATVKQNIYRITEEEYGKDYAKEQHALLAELATIASPQKAAPTPSDSTTD